MRSLVTGVAEAFVFLALAVPSTLAQDRGGSGGGGTHTAGASGHSGGASSGAAAGSGGGNSGGSSVSSGGGFSGGSGSGGGFSSGGMSSGGSSAGGFSAGGGARGRGYGPSPVGMAAGPRNMGNDRTGGPGMGAAVAREGGRLVGSDPRDRSVPAGSRPNYGHPVVGTAVVRGTGRPSGGGTGAYQNGYWYSNPYWSDWNNLHYGSGYFLRGPWGYYSDGFMSRYYSPWARCGYSYPCDPFLLYGYGAWDLGGMFYDPFGWSGMGGYGGGGYSSGGWSSDRSSRDSTRPSGPVGGLKLKVSPSIAEVYVDGYYIGRVDDYNGAFQRLELAAGKHRVELRAKGYQAISFEVDIAARDLIAYRGTMQPLQPGK